MPLELGVPSPVDEPTLSLPAFWLTRGIPAADLLAVDCAVPRLMNIAPKASIRDKNIKDETHEFLSSFDVIFSPVGEQRWFQELGTFVLSCGTC